MTPLSVQERAVSDEILSRAAGSLLAHEEPLSRMERFGRWLTGWLICDVDDQEQPIDWRR